MDQLGQLMLLYDAYGRHLTPRQRQAFALRYAEDLSLGEVAAELATSRPAAAYLLRRARESLLRLEDEVGAVGRESSERRLLERLAELLDNGPAELAEARRMIEERLREGDWGRAGVAE